MRSIIALEKKRVLLLSTLFLLIAALIASARPQGGAPSDMVLIKGARIITMAGEDLATGDLLIRRGKIAAVAERLRAPRGIPVIDATGKVVVPGFIDAHSALLLNPGGSSGGRAESTVLDGVDLFAKRDLESALSQGVTAIHLLPTAPYGLSGRGAVLRLIPDTPLDAMVLETDTALKASIGRGSYGRPIARLGELKNLRSAFKKAIDYRDALDTYDEELEEYLKKIEERATEEEKEEEKKDKKDKKNGAEGKDKKNGPKNTAPKDNDKPPAKKGDKKEDEKEEEELKKPKKPGFNAASAELIKAIEGKIPLFVEAHRAADIVNLLEVVEEYPVKLVLLGCTEGYLVADAIADADATVIVGPVVRDRILENSEFRNHKSCCAATLVRAGVHVVLASSGRQPLETRHLGLNAAQAVAHGVDARKALGAITVDAARVLGVADRIGTIEKGKDADLVIFDSDPLSSSATVERVFIQGKEVFSLGR